MKELVKFTALTFKNKFKYQYMLIAQGANRLAKAAIYRNWCMCANR